MNKFFTKIATAFVGMTMAIGVGVAVGSGREAKSAGATTAGSGYTISSTSATSITNNGLYVLKCNNNDNGFNGSISSNWGSVTETSSDYFILKAVGNTSGFTLEDYGGTSGYIYCSAAKKIEWHASSKTTFTLMTGKKTTTITNAVGNSTVGTLQDGSSGIRPYTSSTGADYQLFAVSAVELTSISVSTAPTKTTYLAGEYFDPTGLVITRTYDDDSSDTYAYAGHTTEFSFSPSTSTALAVDDDSVEITYGGKTCNQAITVSAPKTPSSVSSSGQTTTFDAGEKFTYGGTLTVTYTDNTGGTVTPTSFKIGDAGINPLTAGTVITPNSTVLSKDSHNGKTVYVLYTENNTTVYTSYIITVNSPSSVTFDSSNDHGTSSGQNPDSVAKNGITLSCTSMYGTDSAGYRFYSGSTVEFTSTIGNMAKIEFTGNSGSNKISNMGSESTGSLVTDETNNKATWTGSASSVSFKMTAQGRATTIVVTLESTDPLVELASSSATSVSTMKGDPDTSIKVLVKNINNPSWSFTFDEGEDEGLTESAYISVSASALVENVSTLTITTKAVGSTTIHISVSGTACVETVPVTVVQKPASMTVVHGDIVEGHLEIQSGQYKTISLSGLDTDDDPYTINSDDVEPSIYSGDNCVTLSGKRITGVSEGTAVVRYTLKALTSVYAEVTVDVKDDYLESVNTVTFGSGLAATQGDSPSEAIFTARTGNTHFGSTDTIPLSDFRFSYDDEIGVVADQFSYDFTHGTEVDATHKSQTIYVYCTLGNVSVGTYTVTVEQKDDPLTAITITNVTNNAKEMGRGDSFQLQIAYTPANPTDGKEVVYRVDECDNGVSLTVSNTGLISVSSSSGLGDALVVVESAHDAAIYDFVEVTVVLEEMTYDVDEVETWTLATSLSAGDRVAIVYENGDTLEQLSGVSNNIGQHVAYSKAGEPSTSYIYTVGTGNGANSYTFSSGSTYLAYTSTSTSGSNNLYTVSNPSGTDQLNQVSWTIDFSDFTITNVYNTNRTLRWNAGSPRFCCYVNKGQSAPKIYKLSGGSSTKDVTEALFNAVHNNFGDDKTYEWNEACDALNPFDSSAWLSAGSALTGITGFANYKLNRAVANANGNEIEQFLAKYDVVVDKFGSSYDFLERFADGGINSNTRISFTSPSVNTQSNTVIFLVVISVISGMTICGYFLLRRRKENN